MTTDSGSKKSDISQQAMKIFRFFFCYYFDKKAAKRKQKKEDVEREYAALGNEEKKQKDEEKVEELIAKQKELEEQYKKSCFGRLFGGENSTELVVEYVSADENGKTGEDRRKERRWKTELERREKVKTDWEKATEEEKAMVMKDKAWRARLKRRAQRLKNMIKCDDNDADVADEADDEADQGDNPTIHPPPSPHTLTSTLTIMSNTPSHV